VIVMIQNLLTLEQSQSDLGMPCELMRTPIDKLADDAADGVERWCGDNGAYNRFDPVIYAEFVSSQIHNRHKCRWLTAPDVVGSARRTLEVFSHWFPRLSGWPIAFVAQDGQEDMPIPWSLIACVFIGGSTEWKMGTHAEHIIRAGKAMGKWVHVGRVNTAQRIEKFEDMGVDSIDGSGLTTWSKWRKITAGQLHHPKLDFAKPA
jgi:hypothetical protein